MAIKPAVKRVGKVVRTKSLRKDVPQEVMVYDVLQKERAIAEYRNETKQWFSTKLYKVYHPAFEGGFRWVPNIIRYLGASEES